MLQDENFDVLHSRIPFVTSEAVSAGRTETAEIVALDCEMVSLTSRNLRLWQRVLILGIARRSTPLPA